MGGPRPEPSEAVSLVPLLAQAGVGRSHHPTVCPHGSRSGRRQVPHRRGGPWNVWTLSDRCLSVSQSLLREGHQVTKQM